MPRPATRWLRVWASTALHVQAAGRVLWLLTGASALTHAAHAQQGLHGTAIARPDTTTQPVMPGLGAISPAWDFTLPTLDGGRFVRLRDAHGPVLVNFWGVDCPPCVAELPLLMAFARAQPGWTLLLVGTDPLAAACAFAARLPQPLPPNVWLLRGAVQARALLREAGSPRGGLPHSVARVAGNAGACALHAGMLTEAWLSDTVNICAQTLPTALPARAGAPESKPDATSNLMTPPALATGRSVHRHAAHPQQAPPAWTRQLAEPCRAAG